MNEEKCEFYRENNQYCARYNITCDDGCDYIKLQTTKEENKKLKKIVDIAMEMKSTWDEFDIVNECEIEKLTQQNKQMREALEKIVNLYDEKFPVYYQATFIAQQALKGGE